MARIDKVRRFVEEQSQALFEQGKEPGVDAQTVAEALGIYRTDASSDLNKLWRAGVFIKVGKKPVKYLPPDLYRLFYSNISSTQDRLTKSSKSEHVEKAPYSSGRLCLNSGEESSLADSAFESIIGSNGSLKAQIQLAKAAVSYPPCGLHTLIIGEPGVGKSLLAEAMWRYGVKSGIFRTSEKKEPPFIIFSCADYAENPQLLVSQLFGHVKGAFTGATEDKKGLIDRAQGGILFLDEIHRLPPTGQELLFMLIDKGVYRRLGETDKERTANVMIIGATSEDPQSSLLTTFRRRIPVQIELPRLKDRPLQERLALIVHFLSQESNRLKLPIWFSGQALKILMSYDCAGNIGDLKNDVQLCCAKSYLSYLASRGSFTRGEKGNRRTGGEDPKNQKALSVDIHDVPQKVYSTAQDIEFSEDGYFSKVLSNGIFIKPGHKLPFEAMADDYQLPIDLYEFVEKRLRAYKSTMMSQHEIESKVGEDLERYFYATIWALHGDQPDNMRSGIIAPNIWNLATTVIDKATAKLHRNYSRTVVAALALHLQQFVQRTKAGQIIYNPRLKYIQSEHAREFEIVRDLVPEISRALGIGVPDDEVGFLAMFLARPLERKRKPKVGLIVAAHGRSTAGSMADVANNLLGTNHIRAIDAPLQRSFAEIFDDLCRAVSQNDQGRGVLVLADMGSFLGMEQDITKRIGVRCRIIPNVTTLLVLEAGKVVMTSEGSLDEIADEIMKVHENLVESFGFRNQKGSEPQKDVGKTGMHKAQERSLSQRYLTARTVAARGAIITICPTGAGTACKIRDILLENLPIVRTMDVIPVSALEDVNKFAEGLGTRLRLIVGSIDPGISGVPFVPVDEVLRKDGLGKIDILLKSWNATGEAPDLPKKGTSRQEAINLVESQIDKFVRNVFPEEVKTRCNYVIKKLEEDLYKKELPVDVVVRVYLHVACMLDRLSEGEPLAMPQWGKELRAKRRQEFDFLNSLFNGTASEFKPAVPEGEIFYFLVTLPSLDES